MRTILYSFDDRQSAELSYVSIANNLKKNYNLISASKSQLADIRLNSLYYNASDVYKNKISIKEFPLVNSDKLSKLIDYIKFLDPDIIISDNEYMIPYIGNLLDIETISLSYLNLIKHYKPRAGYLMYSKHLSKYKQDIPSYVFFNKELVYSNFYIYSLFDNYEVNWISTFDNEKISIDQEKICASLYNRDIINNLITKVNNIFPIKEFNSTNADIFITSGENQIISNIIKENYHSQINIIPTFNDLETLLSAIIIRDLNLGLDLGQAEVSESFLLERLLNISEQNKYFNIEFALQSRDIFTKDRRKIIVDYPEPNLLSKFNKSKPNLLQFLKENYE